MSFAPAYELQRNDYVAFGEKALDTGGIMAPKDYEIEFAAKRLIDIAKTSDDKKAIHKVYRDLIDLLDRKDMLEAMDICMDCGHMPETGACNTCKMD